MELKVSNVRKMYNKTVAVKNANLYLERGIYGLLGANGAGKTTLMSMMQMAHTIGQFCGAKRSRCVAERSDVVRF